MERHSCLPSSCNIYAPSITMQCNLKDPPRLASEHRQRSCKYNSANINASNCGRNAIYSGISSLQVQREKEKHVMFMLVVVKF